MEMNLLNRFQEEKSMRLKDGLYHQTQIKLAYNTNRIEGSALSEEQTRYIFDTNILNVNPNESVNVDDIIEAVNHFSCFDFMLDVADGNLSEDMIKEFHRILKTGTMDSRKEWIKTSDYKTSPNTAGGEETTPPADVSDAMYALLDSYRKTTPVDLAAIAGFHYRFEKIHPFQDGNGRLGRIILFKECLKNDIVPFIIEDELKENYYRGLKEFEKTPDCLIETCLSAQDKYREILRNFQDGE
jgi:Fic family protein